MAAMAAKDEEVARVAAESEANADALRKLDPRAQLRNPVMFVVYAGSILTTQGKVHGIHILGQLLLHREW